MSSTNRIGTIEAIFLIVIIMINHIILNLPRNIITSSNSSALLNTIYISILILIVIYFICKLFSKFPRLDILDISELVGGKVFKYAIGILFILYFLFSSSLLIRLFCENLKIIYFPRTPVILLVILFIIGAVICNRLGATAIVRANLLAIPIILISIVAIFFANLENFSFERVLPILGNGFYATFFSGISNIFAFGGIVLLYFIPPNLQENKSFKTVAFSSVIISAIWLLLSVATLLFIFPAVMTTEEILPLYLASRFIEFGRFFQRADSIFLLIWITSVMSYLAIILSFVISIFNKITNTKRLPIIIYAFSIAILILSLIPNNSAQLFFLENTIYKYSVLIIVFLVSPAILIWANVKSSKKGNSQKGDVLID